ncbi:hypothetical protein D3C71_667620 [compost metagenome]
MHRQHASHHVAIEQGNAQPGEGPDRLLSEFDFTACSQSFSLADVNQARSALADHVLGQAPTPTPRWRADGLPLVHVIGKSHFTGRVVEQRNVEVLREQQITDDAMQGLE